MSLKDIILATPFVRQKQPITVPQWPGTEGLLYVRTLTALEDEHRGDAASRSLADTSICYAAELAAMVLVDENGDRIFTTPESIQGLSNGSPDPLKIVIDKYAEMRKAGGDATKKSATTDSPPSSN